jgi:steroid delta-isomerase-like uncharacterized protein
VSEENKNIARRLYGAWSSADFATVDQLLAEDLVEHEELPGLEPTKAGVMQFLKMTSDAFAGFTIRADQVIAEGDKVYTLATATGTHRAEFMGVPATGRQVTVPMADLMRVQDGKVAEHWGVMDSGALMQQLTG